MFHTRKTRSNRLVRRLSAAVGSLALVGSSIVGTTLPAAAAPLEPVPDTPSPSASATEASTTDPAAEAPVASETTPEAPGAPETTASDPAPETTASDPAPETTATNTATNLQASVSSLDGISPFDATDEPGYDSSATNGIIRSGDFVAYRVSVSSDQAVTENFEIKLTLPRGVRLETPSWLANPAGAPPLPAFCGPGSSIVNENGTSTAIGHPIDFISSQANTTDNDQAINDLTAQWWEAADRQVLTCVITGSPEAPAIAKGAAQTFEFDARVAPIIPNGAELEAVGVSVADVELSNDATESTAMTVSAAPKWDLSINGAQAIDNPNSAFVKQATVQKCSYPDLAGTWCWVGGYPVTLSIPDGGRGGIPMDDGAFNFDILTDPVTVWGQAAVDTAAAQGITLPGAYLTITNDSPYGSPDPYPAANNTVQNAVRDSGSVTYTQGTFSRDQQNREYINGVLQTGGSKNVWRDNGGLPVNVSVTGADTTIFPVVTKTRDPQADLPRIAQPPAVGQFIPEKAYVFTQRVFIEVPMTQDVLNTLDNVEGVDLNPAVGEYQFAINVSVDPDSLEFTPLGAQGEGTPTTNVFSDGGPLEGNNYRSGMARLANNMAVETQWIGLTSDDTTTPMGVYAVGFPVWQGPTGPAGRLNGDGVAVPSQNVLLGVHINGDNFGDSSTLTCAAFDNTKVNIKPNPNYIGGGMQAIGSETFTADGGNVPAGSPAYSDGTTWISGSMYNFASLNNKAPYGTTTNNQGNPTFAGMQDRYEGYRVQYGVGTNLDQTCSGVTWYDSYDAVPDPTQITHVRVYVEHEGASNVMYQRTEVSIPFTVIGGEPGDLIEAKTSFSRAIGFNQFDALVDAPLQYTSVYDVENNTGAYDNPTIFSTRSGDRLTLSTAAVRVSAEVETDASSGTFTANREWVPSSRAWRDTPGQSIPAFGPGETGSYRYYPTILSNPATDQPIDFMVETCMASEYLTYDTTATAKTLPNFSGMWDENLANILPYDPQITCAPGDFYMAWQFNDVTVNDTVYEVDLDPSTPEIDPIVVPWRVIDTAPPLVGMINRVLVSSPTDFSLVDQRMDQVTMNIDAPAGLRISKVALPPLITVDPNGWVLVPYVNWNVTLRALDNPNPTKDFDMIDLLPKDGLGGSSFSGPGDFVGATLTDVNPGNPEEPILLYTKSAKPTADADIAAWINPHDEANLAGGTNVWCTAADGTGVEYFSGLANDACPASPADVTGLRVIRPGDFGINETLTLNIRTTAEGNKGGTGVDGAAGDNMVNFAEARATNMDVPMTADAEAVFVTQMYEYNTGTISGRVWDDVDQDGVWDEGEGPIPGATVTLTPEDGAFNRNDCDPNVAFDQRSADTCTPLAPVTVTTDADGYYIFSGLFSDYTYTISFTNPDTFVGPTTPDVPRPDGGVYSVGLTEDIRLTSDPSVQFVHNVDSGFIKVGEPEILKEALDANGDPVTSVETGDVVTYKVSMTNSGDRAYPAFAPASFIDDLTEVLEMGTLQGDPTAVVTLADGTRAADALLEDGTQVGATANGTISRLDALLAWTGPLPVGATVTLTYKVEVTATDPNEWTNVAFVTDDPSDPNVNNGVPTPVPPPDPVTGEPGTPGDPTPTPPYPECLLPLCDSATVAMPQLTIAKTVAGASEPGAMVGDELTYTVTVENTGFVDFTDENPATFVDDISDVLDNGTLVGTPTASVGTVYRTGDSLVWYGPLDVDGTVTLTYTVNVTSTGGDLINVAFVTPPGTPPTDPNTGEPGLPVNPGDGTPVTPPTVEDCAAPTCASTTTPTARLEIAKAVTGASEQGAVVGDVLTYTVTLKNTGTAAYTTELPATFVDDISDVLDNGDIVADSVNASVGTVTQVGDSLVWYGALASDDSVTITYKVKVTNANNHLINVAFVTPPGTPPVDPGTGKPGLPVNPDNGEPVTPPTVDDCEEPTCASTDTPVNPPGTPPVDPGDETPVTPPAPKPTPPHTTPVIEEMDPPTKQLTFTGASVVGLAVLGSVLAAAGTGLVVSRRRKDA